MRATPGITPRKSLGQNFLRDPRALSTIAAQCQATEADTIVEIGPGTGNLTERLLRETQARRVIAIEKDRRLIPELEERFRGEDRLVIVHDDALTVDVTELLSSGRANIAAGNLPYNVATEIYFGLLARRSRFRRIVLMFQREVAERIVGTAGTPAYGVPSVLSAIWSRPRIALRLPPEAFRPAPKVHSAVVAADLSESPLLDVSEDPDDFSAFVRSSLSSRRKTLVNSLLNRKFAARDVIVESMVRLGLDPNVRAEACAPEVLASLWRALRGSL